MLLGDIIEEIAERLPVTIGENSIIRKINMVQREIFRQVRVETLSRWDLLSGQAGYPVKFPKSNILLVNVNGRDYPYIPITADSKRYYYTYIRNSVILHPVPQETVEKGLYIYHYKVPYDLTKGDMEKEPDLDTDFRMLLVYGVLKDISDDAKYEIKYRSLFREYQQNQYEAVPLEIKVGD